MTPARRTSITTGLLFAVAIAAVLVADRLLPALTPDRSADPGRLLASASAYLVAAGTSAGIAIALYPVLRRAAPAAALGAVVFRTVEAVFYTAAVACLLSSSRLAGTGRADAAGALLVVRDVCTLLGVVAFAVGALLYYAVLLRTRLVPRWLAGWGAAAALLIGLACVLATSSGRPVPEYLPLVLPIAAQELVLAGWLLVKGFREPAVPGVVVPAG